MKNYRHSLLYCYSGSRPIIMCYCFALLCWVVLAREVISHGNNPATLVSNGLCFVCICGFSCHLLRVCAAVAHDARDDVDGDREDDGGVVLG